jgi:hypothetical protein
MPTDGRERVLELMKEHEGMSESGAILHLLSKSVGGAALGAAFGALYPFRPLRDQLTEPMKELVEAIGSVAEVDESLRQFPDLWADSILQRIEKGQE